MTSLSDLEFGSIALGPSSGAVIVAPNGSTNCGPHTCLGGQSSASFEVTGLPLTTYDISFSIGDQLDRTGGGSSAALQNLVASDGNTVTTGALGRGVFEVGGELVVGPTNLAGSYTGTFDVTVELP